MLTLILLGLFLQEQAPEKVVPSALHNRSNQDINWMIDPDRDAIIYDEIQAIAAELAEGRIPSNIGCLSFDDRSVIVNDADCAHMRMRYNYLQSLAYLLGQTHNKSEFKGHQLLKKSLMERGLSEAAFDKFVELVKTEYNIDFLYKNFIDNQKRPTMEEMAKGLYTYEDSLKDYKRYEQEKHHFMLNWSNKLLSHFPKRDKAALLSFSFEKFNSSPAKYLFRPHISEEEFLRNQELVRLNYNMMNEGESP